ncbi:TetR family transcriptional regulator [Prescottella agglutinans]|uniref:TetR family transcriptional regulator n=1 Tax=Prescottella agglutinans TaxID=1644129 RepID=UPI001F4E884E|nr:TetR family transcriptional regulator [Prescottella agglutinans]
MESSSTPATPGLRDITREAVRTRISEVAVDLFAEHGFDSVTVEQIATAVGISARSFHRYFPAKEDAVIGDLTRWGEFVRDVLASRPVDEPALVSLRISFESLVSQPRSGEDEQRSKRTMRVLTSTASLRARNLEKHLAWATMLVPVVQARLAGDYAELRAQTLVQAALACFDIALTTWAESEGVDAVDLLRRSFATLAAERAA